MATRKRNSLTKRTDAERLLQDHERKLAAMLGDGLPVLADALHELRGMREREAGLRQEIERLMSEAISADAVTEQLWQALYELREWHKGEYQSSRRIDAQADAALALLTEGKPAKRPN